MKTKADTDQDLVTLNDERLRQLIDEYNDENLEAETVPAIKKYKGDKTCPKFVLSCGMHQL